MTWPAAGPHDLTVVADGFVVTLRCSCGWRCECDDDEVPLPDLVRIAEDHEHAAEQLADVLEHLRLGHSTRMVRERARMAMVCSCGAAWPVDAAA